MGVMCWLGIYCVPTRFILPDPDVVWVESTTPTTGGGTCSVLVHFITISNSTRDRGSENQMIYRYSKAFGSVLILGHMHRGDVFCLNKDVDVELDSLIQ